MNFETSNFLWLCQKFIETLTQEKKIATPNFLYYLLQSISQIFKYPQSTFNPLGEK